MNHAEITAHRQVPEELRAEARMAEVRANGAEAWSRRLEREARTNAIVACGIHAMRHGAPPEDALAGIIRGLCEYAGRLEQQAFISMPAAPVLGDTGPQGAD